MKILIQTNRVIGTATDEYTGPEIFIAAPDNFDTSRIDEYRYENDTLIAPVIPDAWQQKLSDLAAYRYARETAGITLNGAVIKTDLESQSKINGAWSNAQINPTAMIDWKAATGWIQIDAATVTAIAGAVAAHVQACFSAERVHAEAIAALETAEAVQAYDFTTGWPS